MFVYEISMDFWIINILEKNQKNKNSSYGLSLAIFRLKPLLSKNIEAREEDAFGMMELFEKWNFCDWVFIQNGKSCQKMYSKSIRVLMDKHFGVLLGWIRGDMEALRTVGVRKQRSAWTPHPSLKETAFR